MFVASSSKARQHSEVQKETPLEKKSEREIRPGKKKSISSSHVIEGWGDQEGAKTLARVKLRGDKKFKLKEQRMYFLEPCDTDDDTDEAVQRQSGEEDTDDREDSSEETSGYFSNRRSTTIKILGSMLEKKKRHRPTKVRHYKQRGSESSSAGESPEALHLLTGTDFETELENDVFNVENETKQPPRKFSRKSDRNDSHTLPLLEEEPGPHTHTRDGEVKYFRDSQRLLILPPNPRSRKCSSDAGKQKSESENQCSGGGQKKMILLLLPLRSGNGERKLNRAEER